MRMTQQLTFLGPLYSFTKPPKDVQLNHPTREHKYKRRKPNISHSPDHPYLVTTVPVASTSKSKCTGWCPE